MQPFPPHVIGIAQSYFANRDFVVTGFDEKHIYISWDDKEFGFRLWNMGETIDWTLFRIYDTDGGRKTVRVEEGRYRID